MFLLGLFIVLFGMVFFVVALGGDMYFFLNGSNLFAVLFPLAGVLVATQSFDVFFAGLRAAFLPKAEITEDMRGRAASLFRLLSKITALTGAIGSLISLILMLMNLNFYDARGAAMLGTYASSALMIPIYALLLVVIVFEPTVFILKKRSQKKR